MLKLYLILFFCDVIAVPLKNNLFKSLIPDDINDNEQHVPHVPLKSLFKSHHSTKKNGNVLQPFLSNMSRNEIDQTYFLETLDDTDGITPSLKILSKTPQNGKIEVEISFRLSLTHKVAMILLDCIYNKHGTSKSEPPPPPKYTGTSAPPPKYTGTSAPKQLSPSSGFLEKFSQEISPNQMNQMKNLLDTLAESGIAANLKHDDEREAEITFRMFVKEESINSLLKKNDKTFAKENILSLFACPGLTSNPTQSPTASPVNIPTRAPTHTPPKVRIGSDGVRAEIFWNGKWGTICRDDFSQQDAITFCKTLGFDRGEVVLSAQTVDGIGLPIVLDDLKCKPYHVNIFECPGTWGSSNCNHNEDVGVKCYYGTAAPTSFVQPTFNPLPPPDPVRLGTDGYRAEVLVNGKWGTICSEGFDSHDAVTFCRTLGFDEGYVVPSSLGNGIVEDLPVLVYNLQCRWFDENVLECPGNFGPTSLCADYENACVNCVFNNIVSSDSLPPPTASPTETSGVGNRVRIGSDSLRAEIYWNGQWGTICATYFSQVDAWAFCTTLARQRGCSDPLEAHVTERYVESGHGLSVLASDIQCENDDHNIFNCLGNFGEEAECNASEDVGVICHLQC